MTFCKECGEDYADDVWGLWKHLTDPDNLCSFFIYDHMSDKSPIAYSDARFATMHVIISKFRGEKP